MTSNICSFSVYNLGDNSNIWKCIIICPSPYFLGISNNSNEKKNRRGMAD